MAVNTGKNQKGWGSMAVKTGKKKKRKMLNDFQD